MIRWRHLRSWLADLLRGRRGTWTYYSPVSRWDIGERRCGWTPPAADDSVYLFDPQAGGFELYTVEPLSASPRVEFIVARAARRP